MIESGFIIFAIFSFPGFMGKVFGTKFIYRSALLPYPDLWV